MFRARTFAGLILIATVMGLARPALACGASAGGATGISSCSLDEHLEEIRPKLRVGALGAFTSTSLRFDNNEHADQTRYLALATLEWRPTARSVYQAGLGPFIGGALEVRGLRYEMSPGLVGALGAAWRVVDQAGSVPFVLLSAQLSGIFATTTPSGGQPDARADYEAFDLRLGASAGYAIKHVVTPYATARVFGGPITWRISNERVVGTDAHHYQVGGGVSVLVARKVDLFVEGIALGEAGASAGAGFAF